MMRSILQRLTVVALLASVAACGSQSGGDSAPAAAAPAAESVVVDGKPADPASAKIQVTSDEMVAAVPTGKPGAPVALKFDVAKRPKVGEPLDIQVAVLPEAAVNSLQVVFQAGDGLQIKSGGDLQIRSNPSAGREIMHTVVVTPIREGIFYLTAVVVTEAADSQARTFAIPIVVGSPVAAATTAAPTTRDAKGETLSRLPAQESGSTP